MKDIISVITNNNGTNQIKELLPIMSGIDNIKAPQALLDFVIINAVVVVMSIKSAQIFLNLYSFFEVIVEIENGKMIDNQQPK